MRYPHAPAGRMAAPFFAAAGFAYGWLLAIQLSAGPAIAYAIPAAVVAGMCAFLVFSSQSLQRPTSVWQAAVADGVVAGIIAAVTTGVIESLAAGGAGTGQSSPSMGHDVLATVAVGFFSGGLVGALLGYIVLVVGGVRRLERVPPLSRSQEKKQRRRKKKRA